MAISTPKNNEGQVQVWIDQYCPWTQFVFKEAAIIMERNNIMGSNKPYISCVIDNAGRFCNA
jgi:hypothetical protein